MTTNDQIMILINYHPLSSRGSVVKTRDPQPSGPFKPASSSSRALGQGTVSSVPSPSDRT